MPFVLMRGPLSKRSGSRLWSAKNLSLKKSRSWKQQASSGECSIQRGWLIQLSCEKQMGSGGFALISLISIKLVPRTHFPCRALTRLSTLRQDVICFHFLMRIQGIIKFLWQKKTKRRPRLSLHAARIVLYECPLD